MSCPEIDDYYIGEGNYIEEMKKKAEPYLASCAQEAALEREPGHRLYAVRYTPENPRGLIVISHGFIETIDKYRELIYYFLKEGYAVSIHEHCGHGRSYRLTDDPCKVHVDTWERYRDDLLCAAHAAKEACPGLPVYLLGHSMGGAIAAAASAKEPKLFDRVVLSSPMIRPATAGVPWPLTRFLCWFFCGIGKSEGYVITQGPYEKPDRFEDSAALSEERFEYYQEKRRTDPLYQMNGASYSWLRNAVRMNDYFQKEAWKEIRGPVLLLQADDDTFVVNSEQNRFVERLSSRIDARLVHFDNTRHEIFNSRDPEARSFLETILDFLQES